MFLGIDIGGTTLTLGLVDGRTLKKCITVESFGKEASLADTLEYLTGLIGQIISPDVNSIGIGVPTIVDSEKGIAYNATNIPSWKEVHLAEYVSNRFGIPVKINNDANCFALGAANLLCLQKGIVVGVTLGTGIGTGLVVDGKLINGSNTGVGELGSIPWLGKTLEDFCSKGFFTGHGTNPRELFEKASAGDRAALDLFGEYGKNLGMLMSIIVFAYDPHTVIVGGGIANCHSFFEKAMLETICATVPSRSITDNLKIEYCPDPNSALIGASLLLI